MNERCREMRKKYHDLPVDLADATMVSMGKSLELIASSHWTIVISQYIE
ncbi:hypothetical protein L0156_00325 [bacterium]|nr:hypothetical protein [bacterium]